MYTVAINQRDNLDTAIIYSIEKKKWGSIWVRYLDKKNNKKISKSRENIDDLCCKINIFRQIQNLPLIFPKIE